MKTRGFPWPACVRGVNSPNPPRLIFVNSVNPGFPAQNGYGLGLMQLTVTGHERVGQVGQFMGFTTIAMLSPDKGYTIVVICNLSNPELVNVVAKI